MKLALVLALGFIFPQYLEARGLEVLNKNVQQGAVLLVKIDPNYFMEDIYLYPIGPVSRPNKNGISFVPLDFQKVWPGHYVVYLTDLRNGQRVDWGYEEIDVVKKDVNIWDTRRTIRPPSKKLLKERELINNSMSVVGDDLTSGKFIFPLDELVVTDEFGTGRIYWEHVAGKNKKGKKIRLRNKVIVSHGGVDLKAQKPTYVLAVNSGMVVLVGNFSANGKMIVIDHGLGIFSLFLHLSKQLVNVGDFVMKGATIAKTGATPRGIPPHLHFMVKIKGVNVDPIAFIDIVNSIKILTPA